MKKKQLETSVLFIYDIILLRIHYTRNLERRECVYWKDDGKKKLFRWPQQTTR